MAGATAQSHASTHEKHVCTRGLAQRKQASPSELCALAPARTSEQSEDLSFASVYASVASKLALAAARGGS